jgi:hypothetical protein
LLQSADGLGFYLLKRLCILDQKLHVPRLHSQYSPSKCLPEGLFDSKRPRPNGSPRTGHGVGQTAYSQHWQIPTIVDDGPPLW